MQSMLSSLLLTLFLLSASSLPAQSIILSTRSSAAGISGPAGQFEPQELLVTDSLGTAARHLVTRTALDTFLGDANGDLTIHDFTRRIDAVAVNPNPVAGDILGLLLSVDQTLTTLSGQVKDGDIFILTGQGQVQVVFAEDFFANSTQTTTVDVDAFHLAADGTLYFSFANDETTASSTLIAANGGQATLDESTVFKLSPGATEAAILYTRSDILQFVNNALGSSYSTIVDLTGFSNDPSFPGEWIFTTGSTNAAIEGRVFSTAMGGSLAYHLGQTLDSASLGFNDEEVLEGLAVRSGNSDSLRLFGPDTVTSPPGTHAYMVCGATPFQQIQLFGANSLLAAPWTQGISGYSGFPFLYVNPSDPLFSISVSSLDFARFADMNGNAVVSFATAHLPPGLRITMQAFDVGTASVSMPCSAGN